MTTQHHNLINGQWTPGKSYAPNINPSHLADVIGEYAQGDAADVDAAVAAAVAAFPVWSTSGIQALPMHLTRSAAKSSRVRKS